MNYRVSERQQVVIIILLAGFVLFALAFFILAPINMQRLRLEKENEAKTDQLTREGFPLGEEPLIKQREAEERRKRELYAYWETVTNRLSTFPEMKSGNTAAVEHIDYKVALFDVENRLRERAHDLGIKIPRDLGLYDTLRSNEDARSRMLQLRAEEKVLDLLLDLKTGTIRSVEPLDPLQHGTGTRSDVFIEEYPVLVNCLCGVDNVLTLLRALKIRNPTLLVRRMRIQRLPGEATEQLELNATLSVLVFTKSAQSIAPVETRTEPSGPIRPLGH